MSKHKTKLGNPKRSKPSNRIQKGKKPPNKVIKSAAVKKHKWRTGKKEKSTVINANTDVSIASTENNSDGSLSSKSNTSTSQLTLRERMMRKLSAAKFRQINEELDSGAGNTRDAFDNNSSMYVKYHETYRDIKKQWEYNPLDTITKFIKEIRDSETNESEKNITVGDFGCGNGDLINSFSASSDVKVYGFDLFKIHPETIVCNMNSIPLESSCLDIAVFCLSLMAKDVGLFILEANRLLKKRGILLIAEVESRIRGGVKTFIKNLRSYGFVMSNRKNKEPLDKSSKKRSQNDSVGVFVILEFKKIKHVFSNKSLPAINLKPSVYKKR